MIWFDQQLIHHQQDDENRVVAIGNDFTQFQVFMRPKIEKGMLARHEINTELVNKYFDDPGFEDLFFSWMTRQLYEQFNQGA